MTRRQQALSIAHAQSPTLQVEVFVCLFVRRRKKAASSFFGIFSVFCPIMSIERNVRGGHCVIDWEYSAHGMVKWGNERGEWKVFYSISACQALLNCCVGCLVTVLLRDTSAESVLNKTPTICFFLFSLLLVFSRFLCFSISILLLLQVNRVFFPFCFSYWLEEITEPQLWQGTHALTAGMKGRNGVRSDFAEGMLPSVSCRKQYR